MDITKKQLEHLYTIQRKTDAEIATLLGVSRKVIFTLRKKMQIQTNEKQSIISKERLIYLYCDLLKTDKQIAEICHVSLGVVGKSRKKYNIKTIQKSKRHKCNPTSKQIQIIYGTLMGDATISNEKHSVGKSFSCVHSNKQKDYIFWKYEQLKDLCLKPPKQCKYKKWRFSTFYHEYFLKLRHIFYVNNIKIINEDILSKITPLSLAVWFMDDGCNCNEGLSLRFCTCCFTKDEHEIMKKWFYEKFKIGVRIANYGGYRYLIVENDCRKNFINLIKPHIYKSMLYKINTRRLNNVST